MADLSSLKDLAPAQDAAPAHVRKVDSLGRSYATGKRKNAVARVWVKPGTGKITVNGKRIPHLLRPSGPADDPAAADRRSGP
jgi:small subunit ribosomal protein S9